MSLAWISSVWVICARIFPIFQDFPPEKQNKAIFYSPKKKKKIASAILIRNQFANLVRNVALLPFVIVCYVHRSHFIHRWLVWINAWECKTIKQVILIVLFAFQRLISRRLAQIIILSGFSSNLPDAHTHTKYNRNMF